MEEKKRDSKFTSPDALLLSTTTTSSAGEVNLEDLASDKISFSQRGSLLFGGRRMKDLMAKMEDMYGKEPGPPEEVKRVRRKRSVEMLQAALEGRRVLSAEEISLSIKVRSMYDGQQQQAEESVAAPSPPVSRNASINTYGIEDWEDVEGQDVDRYGFIKPNRTGTNSTRQSQGIPRVATEISLEAEQPRRARKIGRETARKRYSRSLTPAMADQDGSNSVYSDRRRSFTTPFSSARQRTLADAANMLSLPPGYDDASESGLTVSEQRRRREWARDQKWQKMAKSVATSSADTKGGGMHFEFDTRDSKVINRTWKGIPDRWRATAWHSFLSASAKRRGNTVSDVTLISIYHQLQEASCADDVQIDIDVPRTINMHVMFRRRYRGGQRLLFRVLHAIALYFPSPGYVQGMASIAATLLGYFNEEETFIMMVRLWELRGMRELFMLESDGLLAALQQFENEWLRDGDVSRKLAELSIPTTAFGTRWYLTLFNLSVPFQAQLRIWDVFMLLGDAPDDRGPFGGADLDILHATSAALLDAVRGILLDADFETAMKVVTSFIPVRDDDVLMRVVRTEWKVKKRRG
ncbi:hypothetical protein K470DRAFT_259417 [Piedraia hortae CBS 480.64]|uniref:Rab-GAP TBC domain-containing protein n=1 Tax=Piedraia hortae CBS 480.64 TaxID=1314780 RepID=A0A6A7BUD0_9PEZI|nr:hypothetical protein K470DRAFT_259417 [Piedraia hortae CBS 480.64]